MGPCRITKKAKLGVCGADVDTIVARNFLRAVAAGVAAHSDHGRTVAEVFLETAEERGEILRRSLPLGVEIVNVEGLWAEQDVAVVVVTPSGRMAPHAVHIRSSAGEMTIEVYGITGRIRYHQGNVLLRDFVRESSE